MSNRLSYAGYLEVNHLVDDVETFCHFLALCKGRELLPIEVTDARSLWWNYRFCNNFRKETEEC